MMHIEREQIEGLIASINPSNFAHEREIGDLYGWCERTQAALREALALKALDAGSATGVTVKPLEWWPLPKPSDDIIEAFTPFGVYRVWGSGNYWFHDFNGGSTSEAFGSSELAKAAAQADYSQGILSALARPASPEVKGEPVVVRLFVHPESESLFVMRDGTEASAVAAGDVGDGMSWEVTDDPTMWDKFIAQQVSSPPADSGGLRAAYDELAAAAGDFLPILERQLASINPDGAALGSVAFQTAKARVERLRAALNGEPNAG